MIYEVTGKKGVPADELFQGFVEQDRQRGLHDRAVAGSTVWIGSDFSMVSSAVFFDRIFRNPGSRGDA